MENCNYKHGKKYIMNYNVKPTPYFLKELKRLSKRYRSLKEDVNLLVASLHENPFQGTDLGKGLHKIRMSITSKGLHRIKQIYCCSHYTTNPNVKT